MKNLEELKVEAEKIRSQVAEGRRLRWPKEFKTRVLEAVAASGRLGEVAKAIGLSQQTIRKWLALNEPTFKQVEVIEEEVSTDIVLFWSTGLNVHGLSFNQLSQLLREGLL